MQNLKNSMTKNESDLYSGGNIPKWNVITKLKINIIKNSKKILQTHYAIQSIKREIWAF